MNVIASTFTFRRNCGNSTQLGEKSDMEKQIDDSVQSQNRSAREK